MSSFELVHPASVENLRQTTKLTEYTFQKNSVKRVFQFRISEFCRLLV